MSNLLSSWLYKRETIRNSKTTNEVQVWVETYKDRCAGSSRDLRLFEFQSSPSETTPVHTNEGISVCVYTGNEKFELLPLTAEQDLHVRCFCSWLITHSIRNLKLLEGFHGNLILQRITRKEQPRSGNLGFTSYRVCCQTGSRFYFSCCMLLMIPNVYLLYY